MSGRPVRKVEDSPPPTAGRPPVKRIEEEGFRQRLRMLMNQRGLNNSKLATVIWGTEIDTRGYEVAKNRDRIGAWLTGRSFPEPDNLRRLADALGVKVEDLAPDAVMSAIDKSSVPALSLVEVHGHPEQVHLQVNLLVSAEAASEVLALLQAHRKRHPGAFAHPPILVEE